MLTINDLTYLIGGRTLFDKANLSISAGHRVGLVGPNGTGKSTLFKLISGELKPDGGEITLSNRATVGWVRQDIPEDDTPLIDIVLAADTERAALMKEAETTEDAERIGYIYSRLEEIGAYEAPSRAQSILAGLGFNDEAQNSAISTFSGGWRMRVALAAALFRQPDLLMLDEPTNHLDFEAMVWLENYLMRYDKTMLIISHDRDILNKTVSHIVHLENKTLVSYTGTYDQFERRRAERLLNQQAMHEKQMAQKDKMMKFVDRFRAKASKARQAQSRLKAIEKMDIVDAVIADRVTAFIFPKPEELLSPMITLENVDVGYAKDAPVLKKLNLRIDMDDRIALLGANGNGKSTLVKLLSGRLAPLSGKIHKSSKMRVGYFAQHQTEELDVTLTPFQLMSNAMKGQGEAKVRAALGKFGFDRHKADTRIAELSGGEKSRLLLCLMALDASHIMLLDEPTNHLDMDAREALMQALNNYEGAVILVSHDPHLVDSVADRLWLVADGGCNPYEEDVEAYKALVVRQRRKERTEARNATKEKKAQRGKNKASPLEKETKAQEQKVYDLTQQRDALENQIAVLSGNGGGKEAVDLNKTLARTVKELAEAEEKWILMQEKLEAES
ncbi:MAG: ABC-F family ATP-binding cassette domain-containing protein [Alphaproteobacteria bacterium]|nr:ABC-F family ATP-binding cassette domain-containing protein [Alphaproteobacteria bacterium]